MKTLDEIGLAYRTDKASTHHDLLKVYEKYLEVWRNNEVRLLEIGIGNLKVDNREGESLLLWEEYFQNGLIYGIDLEDKSFLDRERVRTFQGDQTDEFFLNKVIYTIGSPDIIIDDASHLSALTIKTLDILFPRLKSGGLYIVEDTHTSYWPDWGGDGDTNSMKAETIINYLFKISNALTGQHIPNFRYIKPWHETVESVHFHKSTVVLRKK